MNEALQLYTIKQTSDRVRCSKEHVYELIKCGRLKAHRQAPAAEWRVASGDICRLLKLPQPGSAYQPTDLLTLVELRQLSGFGDRHLRGVLSAGQLPATRIGRRWLVSVACYKKWAKI